MPTRGSWHELTSMLVQSCSKGCTWRQGAPWRWTRQPSPAPPKKVDMSSAVGSVQYGLPCWNHTCEQEKIMMVHFALPWHLMYLCMIIMLLPQLGVITASVSKIRQCVRRSSWSQSAAKAATFQRCWQSCSAAFCHEAARA